MITDIDIQLVWKKWGLEVCTVNSKAEDSCVKMLVFRQGHQGSLHYHPIKDEEFKVVLGEVSIELGKAKAQVGVGKTFRIPPGTQHRVRALTPVAIILETSTYHDDEDVVRLEVSN